MPTMRQVGNFEDYSMRIRGETLEYFAGIIRIGLSPEREYQLHAFGDDEIVAAADMLAYLSEHYQLSPEVSLATVKRWREAVSKQFERFAIEEAGDYQARRRIVVARVFDQLEAAAQARPPFDWNPSEVTSDG